eukprot:scaffold4205_cov74-Phaeocystis_antarctica.AAC.4
MLQLRPRRHCRRCRRRASHAPRGRRLACGCAPRGCGSATRSRSDLHEAEGERGGRPAPFLRAARPALAVAPEPARHLRADPRQCPRAHALQPYLRSVRSAHRIPASPYARATASRAQLLAASKAFIPTAPSPSAST